MKSFITKWQKKIQEKIHLLMNTPLKSFVYLYLFGLIAVIIIHEIASLVVYALTHI